MNEKIHHISLRLHVLGRAGGVAKFHIYGFLPLGALCLHFIKINFEIIEIF